MTASSLCAATTTATLGAMSSFATRFLRTAASAVTKSG